MPLTTILPLPTPGPAAKFDMVWVSFSATEAGQPITLQSRIVPAAGSVLRVRVIRVIPLAAARIGLNSPGFPPGPASFGLIRTPLKRISSIPVSSCVPSAVPVSFANGRVSWRVFSGPDLPLTIATPVFAAFDALTSLMWPLCENLIACVPENRKLSARAAPANANATAKAETTALGEVGCIGIDARPLAAHAHRGEKRQPNRSRAEQREQTRLGCEVDREACDQASRAGIADATRAGG